MKIFPIIFICMYLFGMGFGHVGAGIISLSMAWFTYWSARKLEENYVKADDEQQTA